MSGVAVSEQRKHPKDKSLTDALAEDADAIKARKGLIDKTAVLVKTTEDGDPDAGTGESMRPTDDQLAVINTFTKKKVTADEVVAFPTLSCNDIPDRDDDQFSTKCVKEFAELPQPYSPTGKSFMLDHAYSVGNAVGRIFATDTKKVGGATYLTNEVYVPNTPQFQPIIEKIDFGISWAVSVGVMLGKDECSVCKEPFSSWGWWCRNGHDKGLWYDPNSDETDAYGYPEPVAPDSKGAIKCIRIFSEPRDMYELSQVFLGAQYFAAIDKDPGFKALAKSVMDPKVPIVGLSREEVKSLDLPIPHAPKKLVEARKAGWKITEADDGSFVWKDPQGLRWTFNPESPEDGVLSLGKATNNDSEEEDDGEHEVPGGPGSGEGDEGDEVDAPVADAEAGVRRSGSGSDPGAADGEQQGGGSGALSQSADDEDEDEEDEDSEDSEDDEDDSSDEEDAEDEDSENNGEEEKSVSKKAVLAAASKAKLPKSVIDAAEEASGNGLTALLLAASSEIEKLAGEAKSLQPKAALGDQFLTELRAEAIDAYVKNHTTKDDPKVSTEIFERLLDKCGDDVDLLKAMAEEQMTEARKKFPKARRSSFPSDPNEVTPLGKAAIGEDEGPDEESDRRVKRIHG